MNTTNQNKWYAFVPNMLTLFNLISGVIAIYFAFGNNIQTALLLMIVGGVFDFFDGFVARLLKVSGELGKQLDSLADLISFGLLPGVMVFTVQRELILNNAGGFNELSPLNWIYLISPILIPVFSAIRLGKFNIDTRQTSSFLGLPTPANALFFASLTWSIYHNELFSQLGNPLLLALLVLAFSLIMVSEIPLFALKFSSYKWEGNQIRYIFIIGALLLISIFQIPGVAFSILLYILLSITKKII